MRRIEGRRPVRACRRPTSTDRSGSPVAAAEGATPPLVPLDELLLRRAGLGLSLNDEPFAALGSGLDLSGEAVIEQLHELMRSQVIAGVGLVWAPGGEGRLNDPTERALQEATAWGLPLVQRPYEALGAMLGWPAARVQSQLAAWVARGDLERIAPLPSHPW